MNAKSHIAIVEDNAPQRTILSRLLCDEYEVSDFDSGEAFLACPHEFDAVLLDIEMPGLNGYDTCRQLRAKPDGSAATVIFVSGHDTAPERVAAYEAGGDDFVTKPINAHELRHKVKSAVEQRLRLRELSERSSNAQQIAFTAMTSMGDLGVVIEFLRRSTNATDYDSIANYLMDAMRAWGLRGAVQIRGRTGQIEKSTEDQITPLQASVLATLKDMGRIFELGSRAVINYSNISLLVQNLPTEDPDKVGRLRDHLAVLAESADTRIHGLDAVSERNLQKVGIEGALAELRGALVRLSERTQANRAAGQSQMMETLSYLMRALRTLDLSEHQAAYVDDLSRQAEEDAHHFFDQAISLESEFADVLSRLERLAASDYRL